MLVLEILTVCCCCAIAATSVAENTSVPIDPLLEMFTRQELLLNELERLTTLKFSELENKVNALASNVVNLQDDINAVNEAMVNKTLPLLQKHISDVRDGITKILSRTAVFPADYTKNYFGCYKLYTTPMSWQQADDRCKADGAHLAVIESDEEMAKIWEFIGQTQTQTYLDAIWIGGRRVNGVWKWVDKSKPFGYTVWTSREHNKRLNPSLQQFVVLNDTQDVHLVSAFLIQNTIRY